MATSILYTDLSTYGWSASTDPDIKNLYDYETATTASVLSNVPQAWFSAIFPTSQSFSCVIFDNHNWTTSSADLGSNLADCYVQYSDDGVNWMTLVLGFLPQINASNHGPVMVSFTPTSKRYWRLMLDTSSGNFAHHPYVGNIFSGNLFTFGSQYNWDYKAQDRAYNTVQNTTLSGITKTSQVYGGKKTWAVQYTLQNDATKTAYRTFMNTVRGSLFPFYFIDIDGSINYVHLTDDYSPVTANRFGTNSITLNLKSHGTY
jgi:hypothetical protein